MEKQVEIASFVEQSVGKAIRSSKKKYEWIFFINNSKNIVEVYRSSMSGKIRVIFNNTQLHYEQKYSVVNYSGLLEITLFTTTITENLASRLLKKEGRSN